MQTEPMPDRDNLPKPGDVFFHIQSDMHQLNWVGIAYVVQDPPTRAKAVATAVSGSSQRVRSMLRAKMKRQGLTPP